MKHNSTVICAVLEAIFCFVAAVCLSMILAGCKTVKPAIVEKNDSVRVEVKNVHDSIYILKYDSIYIKEKGDTVYELRVRTDVRYLEHVRVDTITNEVVKEVEKVVEVNKLTPKQERQIRGYKWMIGILISLAIGLAGYFVAVKTKVGKLAIAAIKSFLHL